MHLQGKPVCSFDPEGLIFAAGINSEMVKLYDLRSFDKVRSQKTAGGSSRCFPLSLAAFLHNFVCIFGPSGETGVMEMPELS